MPKSLTVDRIKQIIKEEKASLKKAGVIASDVIEDAWSGGDNLVNKIDYVKKLGIKEQKHLKKAKVYKMLREKLQESIKRSK